MIWLLLILTLPTENATVRMRAWRALKASGAAVLRDGVYLLPAADAHRATLTAIAEDATASGGTTWLLEATGEDYAGLFDRTAEYQQLAADIAANRSQLDKSAAVDLARLAKKLRKTLDGLRAIDFFPGQALAQTTELLDEFDDALRARLSPDEPTARVAAIPRRNPADYAGRLWATRKRPWVDRLASAWLIRRFIDRRAKFLWLDKPAKCPKTALGFDFDGAAFTHVGGRVTFEVLAASFGLDADPALSKIAAIVHCLDVGGVPVVEAAGIEAVLAGLRAASGDDDKLLTAAARVFDGLYQHYQQESTHG